jgi:hypothetical protein
VDNERWPIRIGRRSRWFVRLWTATPDTSWVQLDGELEVRFGRFRFRTPVSNLDRWRIEGPFLWITAIGVRRGILHGDMSFAGSNHGSVRLDLVTPVPWGPLRVPAVWVAVDDLEGFAAALTSRGIPGIDARGER